MLTAAFVLACVAGFFALANGRIDGILLSIALILMLWAPVIH